MLVLSRRVGEAVVIGDDIHIKVVAVVGHKVRLGIAAPEEVLVDRQEVHEERRNRQARKPTPTEPDRPVG
jgi:carbon storage regulator